MGEQFLDFVEGENCYAGGHIAHGGPCEVWVDYRRPSGETGYCVCVLTSVHLIVHNTIFVETLQEKRHNLLFEGFNNRSVTMKL